MRRLQNADGVEQVATLDRKAAQFVALLGPEYLRPMQELSLDHILWPAALSVRPKLHPARRSPPGSRLRAQHHSESPAFLVHCAGRAAFPRACCRSRRTPSASRDGQAGADCCVPSRPSFGTPVLRGSADGREDHARVFLKTATLRDGLSRPLDQARGANQIAVQLAIGLRQAGQSALVFGE